MMTAVGFVAITIGVFFLPIAFLVLAALQWSRDKKSAVLLLLMAAIFGFIGTGVGSGEWLTYTLNDTSQRAIFGSALALAALTLLLRREALRRRREAEEKSNVGIFETAVAWMVVVVCVASLAGLPGLGQVAEELAQL